MAEGVIQPTATAPRPAQTGERFPAFDGLRAIAAMAVMVTHITLSSGWMARSSTWGAFAARLDVGVAVFFVISGFLLYRPFVAANLTANSAPATGPYAWRRALRILPAYWVVLTAVMLVPAIQGANVGHLTAWRIIGHYLLIQNYHLYFSLLPVQQAWTLVTEVAFYVLLPIWALAMRRLVRSAAPQQRFRRELIGVAALYVVGLASRAAVLKGVSNPGWRGTMNLWIFPRLDHFALGMLLAVLSAHHDQLSAVPRWARHRLLPYTSWALALGSFWFMSVGFGLNNRRLPEGFTFRQEFFLYGMWGLVGLFTVAPAVFGEQRRSLVHRFLLLRPMVYLGLVSYGIYLWHEAMMDFYLRRRHLFVAGGQFRSSSLPKMALFVIVATIALASISYFFVERPALRFKNRVPRFLRPRAASTGA
jgi:peptidoglycan/LPS O-acetylase OafA/YrhL